MGLWIVGNVVDAKKKKEFEWNYFYFAFSSSFKEFLGIGKVNAVSKEIFFFFLVVLKTGDICIHVMFAFHLNFIGKVYRTRWFIQPGEG